MEEEEREVEKIIRRSGVQYLHEPAPNHFPQVLSRQLRVTIIECPR